MSVPLNRTLVVMPAWNEEGVVGDVVREVFSTLSDVNVLVVSDGSTDRTALEARSAGATVLELPFNLGVGAAMRLGFRYARENGYLAAVQVDADGQHNPSDVPALLDALEESDVAIGARFAGEGDYVVSGPRHWAMRLLSKSLSWATGTYLTDTTSGFKAHNRRAIEFFSRNYPSEYLGDTIEALLIGHREGLVITQRPVAMRPRAGGAPSHNPVRAGLYLVRAFLALMVAFLRPSKVSDR